MPIKGRKRPNLASAQAHINIEENDWIPAPITYAGSGALVPAELLPEQHLTEPIELLAGRYFVPDVAGSVHGNDTPGRKNAREGDTIEQSEIKRDLRDPPRDVVPASGVSVRPGNADKERAG